MLGEILITKDISNESEFQIDTSALQLGMYFIEMTNENGSIFRKRVLKVN